MTEIRTRVAELGFPEHRFRGRAVFADLVGKVSYAELIARAVGGPSLDGDDVALLDALAAITSVADPRIWPLKLTRIAASYGGMLAGFAAGQLPLEGDRIGPPITKHAAELLVAATESEDLAALIADKSRLVGYGIPFRAYDERFVALRELVEERGRAGRRYWRTQEALSSVVLRVRALPPNIGIGTAALLLDMDFTPFECAAVVHFLNQHVFVANAVEGAQQQTEMLRQLPASNIRYVGKPPRRSAETS